MTLAALAVSDGDFWRGRVAVCQPGTIDSGDCKMTNEKQYTLLKSHNYKDTNNTNQIIAISTHHTSKEAYQQTRIQLRNNNLPSNRVTYVLVVITLEL